MQTLGILKAAATALMAVCGIAAVAPPRLNVVATTQDLGAIAQEVGTAFDLYWNSESAYPADSLMHVVGAEEVPGGVDEHHAGGMFWFRRRTFSGS